MQLVSLPNSPQSVTINQHVSQALIQDFVKLTSVKALFADLFYQLSEGNATLAFSLLLSSDLATVLK
jgi:hypothetical protein